MCRSEHTEMSALSFAPFAGALCSPLTLQRSQPVVILSAAVCGCLCLPDLMASFAEAPAGDVERGAKIFKTKCVAG